MRCRRIVVELWSCTIVATTLGCASLPRLEQEDSAVPSDAAGDFAGDAALPPSVDLQIDPIDDGSLDHGRPSRNEWVEVQSDLPQLEGHSATLLADGRVLIAGGLVQREGGAGRRAIAEAFLYLPEQDRFIQVASLAHTRGHHAAVLLPDHRVLVIGGDISGNGYDWSASTEIFDPYARVDGGWSEGPALPAAPPVPVAGRLTDGRIVMVDGVGATIAALDAGQSRWQLQEVGLDHPRGGAAVALLDASRVLVAGGYEVGEGRLGTYHDTIVMVDLQIGSVTQQPGRLPNGRSGASAARLDDGKVLIVGGACDGGGSPLCRVGTNALFDPDTGQVTSVAEPDGEAPTEHAVVQLRDGRVAVFGGTGASLSRRAVAYDLTAKTWEALARMPEPGWSGHTATLLLDGSVLVVGSASAAGEQQLAAAARYYP